jgi:hypothetical protein
MVHQLGRENRLGGEFLDLLGVLRVIGNGAGSGLAHAGCAKQRQTKDDTGKTAIHETPRQREKSERAII